MFSRTVLAAAILGSSLAITAARAEDTSQMCLSVYQIDNTRVADPTTILFRMKDGKVWRNTLRSSCESLRFNGFAYVVHGGELCRSDAIHVLETHELCLLGPFTPEKPAKGS